MAIKKKIEEKMTDAQRIEFAKQIEDMYAATHASLKKVALFSFIRGVATGLGVFLGGTIVVSLLLWLLSLLPSMPFVGDISNKAEHSIQEVKE